MEPIDRDKVLTIVKMRGPLIPTELKRALGQGDTMLIGAMLSELSSKGHIKISKTKLGGTPFYYDPAQPEKLERVAEHLGEKDKRTWQLLKEKKVLRDTRQEALVRVSLRNLKDFALPLQINAPEGELLYWKYYLVSDNEAEQLIKEELGLVKKAAVEPSVEERVTEENAQQEPQQQESTSTPQREELEKNDEKPLKKAEPEGSATHAPPEKQRRLGEEPVTEQMDDEFYMLVKRYFDENKIGIVSQEIIRKKSEIDFVIMMPTPVGNIEFYCKAKSKKKSNDGDLANAKLEGITRQLPVLYLTTGEVTKKAKESFTGIVVKEV
jgi:hypothetical protein